MSGEFDFVSGASDDWEYNDGWMDDDQIDALFDLADDPAAATEEFGELGAVLSSLKMTLADGPTVEANDELAAFMASGGASDNQIEINPDDAVVDLTFTDTTAPLSLVPEYTSSDDESLPPLDAVEVEVELAVFDPNQMLRVLTTPDELSAARVQRDRHRTAWWGSVAAAAAAIAVFVSTLGIPGVSDNSRFSGDRTPGVSTADVANNGEVPAANDAAPADAVDAGVSDLTPEINADAVVPEVLVDTPPGDTNDGATGEGVTVEGVTVDDTTASADPDGTDALLGETVAEPTTNDSNANNTADPAPANPAPTQQASAPANPAAAPAAPPQEAPAEDANDSGTPRYQTPATPATATPAPVPTAVPAPVVVVPEPTPVPTPTAEPEALILNDPQWGTPTPVPTEAPEPTPAPTAAPEPTPVPTVAPAPTPEAPLPIPVPGSDGTPPETGGGGD